MKNLLAKNFILMFLVITLGFLSWENVLAKDYDIYVDVDGSDSDNGSESNPYKTVAKAIQEAEIEDEIYIEEGVYNEDLVIAKRISLFGADLKDVVIDGQIEISENVEAQKFTIKGNVIVESGADIIFDNLIIKEASGNAIDAYSGNGEIVVKNSTIKRARNKGFYIQKGRDIIISSCNVYSNEEEGIDLRSNVDGTISGNNIYDNGESGIELIISDSSLNIKDNVIKNNGSSGVASQYYEDLDEDGDIKVNNNTMTGNDKYGFDCGYPQGGGWESDFWMKSIELVGNDLTGNDKGKINKDCGLSQAVVKKEATEAQTEAQKKAREEELVENEKEKEIQAQLEQQNRQKTVQENEYNLNKLVASKKELKDEVILEKEKIEGRGGLVAFLIGPNYGAIENIKEVAPGFGEHQADFDEIDRKLIETENQQIVQAELKDIVNFVQEVNDLIVEKDSKFSLFGWVFRIFK